MRSALSEFLVSFGCHTDPLYEEAFTHASYRNEMRLDADLERLEYLGDAVVQLIVSNYLYTQYPDLDQGDLTIIRSRLVRAETLAEIASKWHLPDYLRLGHGEQRTGGRRRVSIQCDLFEAFVGAMYRVEGWQFVEAKVLAEMTLIVEQNQVEPVLDFKTRLQEVVQLDPTQSIEYRILETTGPANAPTFVAAVYVNGLKLGTGQGSSKKQAEQEAAALALEKMVR